MSKRKKMDDNQPGMDQKRDIHNEEYQQTKRTAISGQQEQASFHPGSTTQGGSNYGQGSSHLSGGHYHQGSEGRQGSNYESEAGKLSEERDDIPHGHGAHINEKESTAQEDYPGLQQSEFIEEQKKDEDEEI